MYRKMFFYVGAEGLVRRQPMPSSYRTYTTKVPDFAGTSFRVLNGVFIKVFWRNVRGKSIGVDTNHDSSQ
jgi:hypothetical protein